MRARIPLDVDLEDKLIYGLSPVRFGYLVIAALGALSLWKLDPVPVGLRLLLCLLVLAVGSALAWGRWQGRPVDGWAADVAVFVRRNYRAGPARSRRRPSASQRVSFAAISALRGGHGDEAAGLEPAA